MLLTLALELSAKSMFVQERVLTSMYTVRFEPTKLILVGTRTTYQATGVSSPNHAVAAVAVES